MAKKDDAALKDITRSTHAPKAGDPESDPVYVKTRSLVMRVGTVFFVGLAVCMFFPIVIGVGKGIANERVWDPYTGKPVYEKRADESEFCLDEGRRLLLEAGRHDKLVRVWAEPYRLWQMRCRAGHKELYELLSTTREELRLQKKGLPPKKDEPGD